MNSAVMLGDVLEREARGQAEPEVPILVCPQRLVEAADREPTAARVHGAEHRKLIVHQQAGPVEVVRVRPVAGDRAIAAVLFHLDDAEGVAVDDALGLLLEERHEGLEVLGVEAVVVVEVCDEAAARDAEAAVAGGREAAVHGVAHVTDASAVVERVDDVLNVAAAVVHDDDLEVAIGLGEDALERDPQRVGSVVGRDDHRDGRASHAGRVQLEARRRRRHGSSGGGTRRRRGRRTRCSRRQRPERGRARGRRPAGRVCVGIREGVDAPKRALAFEELDARGVDAERLQRHREIDALAGRRRFEGHDEPADVGVCDAAERLEAAAHLGATSETAARDGIVRDRHGLGAYGAGGVEERGRELERRPRRPQERRTELGAGVQLGLAAIAARGERRKELLDVELPAARDRVPHDLAARRGDALALLHGHAVGMDPVVIEHLGHVNGGRALDDAEPHVPVLGSFEGGIVGADRLLAAPPVEEGGDAGVLLKSERTVTSWSRWMPVMRPSSSIHANAEYAKPASGKRSSAPTSASRKSGAQWLSADVQVRSSPRACAKPAFSAPRAAGDSPGARPRSADR